MGLKFVILRRICRNELFFMSFYIKLYFKTRVQVPKYGKLLKQFSPRKILLQFFILNEEDSSPLIVVRLVLNRFQNIVEVRYWKKKCLKFISIKSPSVGTKDSLLILVFILFLVFFFVCLFIF